MRLIRLKEFLGVQVRRRLGLRFECCREAGVQGRVHMVTGVGLACDSGLTRTDVHAQTPRHREPTS